jgi:4-amino-4-deoxy-L-arabinose transferase-like glycosyltransferase
LVYPYDIEWAEGAALNQVFRILSGDPLFIEPNTTFSPLVYTPLYYLISAGLSRMIGTGFLPLRLISVISSIGAGILIFWIVKKVTGNDIAGWLAASLYVGCFELADGFFDLARVDSLFVLVLLMTLAVFMYTKGKWRLLFTGIMIAMGFYVKQSALIVFLPIIIVPLITNFRKHWPLLITALLGISVPWLFLDLRWDGLFSYYIFYLPGQHGYSILSAANFWIGDILHPLGIALGFITFSVVSKLNRSARNGKWIDHFKEGLDESLEGSTNQILLFGIGALVASWITRASNGGGGNNVMAAYAAISLCFGIGYHQSVAHIEEKNANGIKFDLLIPILVLIQLLGLLYNPFKYIPNETDYSLNRNLVERIEAEDEVLIPYRSHFSVMLGKGSSIHIVNLFELTGYFKGDVLPEGKAIVDEIRQGICSQEYGLIIIDSPIPWFDSQIESAYDKVEFDVGDVGTGLIYQSQATDWQNGFKNMYRPKSFIVTDDCIK